MSHPYSRAIGRRVAALAVLLLISSTAWAGTTGKLTGKVVNEKKEPLAGVNIRVEGQRLGALTDDNGVFVIVGVPGGTWAVHANLLGYAPSLAERVAITPDFTTTL